MSEPPAMLYFSWDFRLSHRQLAQILWGWDKGRSRNMTLKRPRLLGEATEGLHGRTDCAPFHWFAVVALFQEVLVAAVVGMLVEDPVAVQNFAGMDLSQAVPLQHRWTVIHGLYGLACEVGLVVQLNFVLHSACLQGRWDGMGRL